MPRHSHVITHCTSAVVFISLAFAAASPLLTFGPIKAASAGVCQSDSKLLNGGPTLVFGDGPGTWWGLIKDGLTAAGLDTVQEQIDYLNGIFGTNYSDLNSLKTFNLQLVNRYDENGNGYVCAFDLRGTRAHFRDPYSQYTYYGINDDKIARK